FDHQVRVHLGLVLLSSTHVRTPCVVEETSSLEAPRGQGLCESAYDCCSPDGCSITTSAGGWGSCSTGCSACSSACSVPGSPCWVISDSRRLSSDSVTSAYSL